MSELSTRKQTAVEALARHFSATWEKGEEPPDAYVTIAGKRISVNVAIMKRRIERGGPRKPRLRFDKVALRFVSDLQAALRESIPEGKAVMLTISAPIRLPSKTAAELEDKIRIRLGHRPAQAEFRSTIHGNQIHFRLVSGVSRRTSTVFGFVHNPDSDPDALLDAAHSLLECIGAEAGNRASAKFSGDRWLVVIDDAGQLLIETYRHVCSQLRIPTDFTKILMVLSGGRVEDLTG